MCQTKFNILKMAKIKIEDLNYSGENVTDLNYTFDKNYTFDNYFLLKTN